MSRAVVWERGLGEGKRKGQCQIITLINARSGACYAGGQQTWKVDTCEWLKACTSIVL